MRRLLLPIGTLGVLGLAWATGRPAGFAAGAFLLSLLSFAPLPGAVARTLDRAGRLLEKIFPAALPAVVLPLLLFYAWLWASPGRNFQPVVHDEFAYLFQAKTFLAGRTSFPSPPEPLFFDAFHILTDPVYASKYPPGHAAALLPGVALGAPWLTPLLLAGTSLLLLGRLARPWIGAGGALLLVLLFGLSPTALQNGPSYLSQNTSLALGLGFLAILRRSAAPGGGFAPLFAGALLGALFLTRPWNALILGSLLLPILLASSVLRRTLLSPRGALLFAAPLVVALGTALAYQKAVTGFSTTTPWQLYAKKCQPEDRLGFYDGAPVEAREVGPGKRMYNERILYPNWMRYTPGVALRSLLSVRVPMSAVEALPPVGFALLFPLLFSRRRRKAFLFPLGFVLLTHLAYLFYWFPWGPYFHDITPVLVFLPLLGAASLRDGSEKGGGAGSWAAALLLVALTAGLAAARLPAQIDFRATKASYHARFSALVERRVPEGSILFLRYGRNHNPDLDLINNGPDLDRARRLYVYDLGEDRNRRLLAEHYPDRRPFFYDEATRRLLSGYSGE